MVERHPYKVDVAGSNPVLPTKYLISRWFFSFWGLGIGRVVESMGKVLGLTKNNHKYKNVPDKLKWAIPIHEAISRPEVINQGKALEVLVDQKIAHEEKLKRTQTFGKLRAFPDISK